MCIFRQYSRLLSLRTAPFLLFILVLGACKMEANDSKNLPSRHQIMPLFNPHMPTFKCQIEATKVPDVDAQADVWFHEAIALDSADIFPQQRDYSKIVQLTRQAAERRHWKAMLNLASLYIEGRDPAHSVEDAVRLVEEAMRLNIPAAYDRMGTYFFNGTGVKADATRAYAFWQRAAEMGSPQAMAYLGARLDAVWDDPNGTFWSNMSVGIKMLECAYGQGNGDAAYHLALSYISPPGRDATRNERQRALVVLHNGVKFGSEMCANKLQIEFAEPFELDKMLAPRIDKERAERYGMLGDALSFDPSDRFPNLDKVLPLPPARLPPWNGDRDTLLNAARGVKPPGVPPRPTAASQRAGRFFLDAAFALRDTGHQTKETVVPTEGYWQPTAVDLPDEEQAVLRAIAPGLYRRGEPFPIFDHQVGNGVIKGVTWRRWDTISVDYDAVMPPAAANRVRVVSRPEPRVSCASESSCPISGTWQPWLFHDHPLQLAVNQYWRQVWLVEGQRFPSPEYDWLLPVSDEDITWHLMDAGKPVLL